MFLFSLGIVSRMFGVSALSSVLSMNGIIPLKLGKVIEVNFIQHRGVKI